MGFTCLTAGVNPNPCLHRSPRVTSMAAIPRSNNNEKSKKYSSNIKPSRARRVIPKNLRAPRRSKLPPDFGTNQFLKHHPQTRPKSESEEEEHSGEENISWEKEELEAITFLFQGRVPQKPGKLSRERCLPLPLPHKLRPLALPSPKKRRIKIESFSGKTPSAMISLAREIKALSDKQDVSSVLEKWTPFLRKGSLSMTVRELGHMGLHDRAHQTFLWAQGKPSLSPDDRTLSSTVEILARNRSIKPPSSLESASKGVIESLVKGFARGGNPRPALEILSKAKAANRTLDPSAFAKLISELSKCPERRELVSNLLDELGERRDLSLTQQDCTALITACARVGRFGSAESLFDWFVGSGREPSVVMYTALVHGRWIDGRFREAMEAVWEMEGSHCLLDLPAFRVLIRLFATVNDIPRASRYFSKMKESGFSPTYDVYRDMIRLYLASRRIAKCREICREAETAGFRVEQDIIYELSDLAK